MHGLLGSTKNFVFSTNLKFCSFFQEASESHVKISHLQYMEVKKKLQQMICSVLHCPVYSVHTYWMELILYAMAIVHIRKPMMLIYVSAK